MINSLLRCRNEFLLQCYNKIVGNGFRSVFYDKVLIECSGRESPSRLAIGDHICAIFSDLIAREPSLIVELGTRGGESTRAILAAAQHVGARVLSIDIDPRPEFALPERCEKAWEFVQADDVEFGENQFEPWCRANGLLPQADALFIDTSHEYEHTRREIEIWFRFVPKNGIVMFHDTNMGNLYRRMDNTVALGWNNTRGVMRALEQYLGREYDETKAFVDVTDNWLVRHQPYSSGLTFMKRLAAIAERRAAE